LSRKRIGRILLAAVLAAVMAAAAGCGKTPSAKDVLDDALQASLNMESYSFSGSLRLNLEADEALLQQNAELAFLLAAAKNAELRYRGVYRKDPMQSEIILDLDIRGDMSMSLSLPIVMTEDTLWIKIPNLPLLAGVIPPNLAGKFVRIGLEDLGGAGGLSAGAAALDVDAQQRLGLEIARILVDSFEEKTYFAVLDRKDAGLPEAANAARAVRFRLSGENQEEALETILKQALPRMLDVLARPENLALLQLDEDDFEEFRRQTTADGGEWREAVREFGERFRLHELTFTLGVDKNNFITYQEAKADLEVREGGSSMRVGLALVNLNEHINREPSFEIGIPADGDTVDLTDLIGGLAF